MARRHPPDPARQRAWMVEHDLRGRGIHDERVLAAMGRVAREHFVDASLADAAYRDQPLPIEAGQTISQPFVVALMTQALELRPTDRVLEIGTGSGYGAAVLAELVGEVWTVERHQVLADQAADRLRAAGTGHVTVVTGDGTLGWPPAAPYDAIVATAGAPSIPEALLDQLADGGRLVIPVGRVERSQQLLRIRRHGDDLIEEDLGPVRFVPLVGEQGWRPQGR